jgi:pimeloyl-ACP methyl ester carboxylesterase
MSEKLIKADGVEIATQAFGNPADEPVLLVMGVMASMLWWPEAFCERLAAHGRYVIRYDNRDTGLSTTYVPGEAPYSFDDMADDAGRVLDAYGITAAHIVGMSMGGMIAQTLAARHPDRVATLTSIFSTTGHRRVGRPARSTLLRMAQRPSRTAEESARRHLAMLSHIGSASFPPDVDVERAWALGLWDRTGGLTGRQGIPRQISAIQASGDRTAELARITAPTLVVHGDTDLMVHPSGGRATARAIPTARHVEIAGMAHHLAPGVIDQLVGLTTGLAHTSPAS